MTTDESRTPDDVAAAELSLPEELQLALPPFGGQLRPGSMDLAVAAIIDLALRGNLVATPTRWGQPSEAKLALVDASPTGHDCLDVMLRSFVARGKTWKIHSCINKHWEVVSKATTRSLVARGALAAHGTMRDRDGYLEPVDLALRDQYVSRLANAPQPEDPRAAVLLDIRHYSAWGWTPLPGQTKAPILGNYPGSVEVAARGALSALYIATGSAA